MSKLLSEYQGKRATSIALPKLSPTAPSRAAVTTAIQGTTSLQSSLATMSKFLEERALQASIQSGFDYSLANQPTVEEIDGMIEKKEEKIPFQPNSMNIAELTANEYISAEASLKRNLSSAWLTFIFKLSNSPNIHLFWSCLTVFGSKFVSRVILYVEINRAAFHILVIKFL